MSRFHLSSLLLTLLAAAPQTAVAQAYCSSRTGLTTAGTSVTSTYGRIVIIGDSLLAGRGNTQGRYETAIAAGLDDTLVVNNAVGGNSLEVIAESYACSCASDCQWAIIDGGINGHRNRDISEIVDEMKDLVQRELDAGRKVVIQGYVPDCDRNASGENFDGFLDGYRDYAASTANVYFVDPRVAADFPGHELMARPCEDEENLYRAADQSHPSPLSGEVMGTKVAEVIREAVQPDTDAPTKSPTKAPTKNPTAAPTTSSPTRSPTTASPTESFQPTNSPTQAPTSSPTLSPCTTSNNQVGKILELELLVDTKSGTELMWELTNELVPSSGWRANQNFEFPTQQVLTYEMCLPLDECWNLVLEDSGSDGLLDGGYYKFSIAGQEIVQANNFNDRIAEHEICLGQTGRFCKDRSPGRKFRYKQTKGRRTKTKKASCEELASRKFRGRKRKKACKSDTVNNNGENIGKVHTRCMVTCGRVGTGDCSFLKEYDDDKTDKVDPDNMVPIDFVSSVAKADNVFDW